MWLQQCLHSFWGDIIVVGNNGIQVAFKNCTPFIKCITKVDGTTKNDAEGLNLVISMHNLLEYSLNYSDTTGSLWFYSKDETTNSNAHIRNNAASKSL